MLERYQILLTDWLAEHMKLVAKRNDLSFSEMIRIVLCEGLLHSAESVYPDYKIKVNKKLLLSITKNGSAVNASLARKHELTSQLYFETRKVLECINERLTKELKNK